MTSLVRTKVGIERCATYIPTDRVQAVDLMARRGLTRAAAKVHSRLFGLSAAASGSEHETVEDMLAKALATMFEDGPLLPPDLVLLAHALPALAPRTTPLVERVLAPIFGRTLPRAIGISHHNCTSLLTAMRLARTLVANGAIRRVLILACDPMNRFALEERFIEGTTVIGDAAACVLISDAPSVFPILGFGHVHDMRFHHGLHATPSEQNDFFAAHDRLFLRATDLALAEAGIALHDLTRIYAHNTNRAVWNRIAAKTGFPRERIDTSLVTDVGHAFTVDPLLGFDQALRRGELASGDLCLFATVGFGSFAAAAVVQIS